MQVCRRIIPILSVAFALNFAASDAAQAMDKCEQLIHLKLENATIEHSELADPGFSIPNAMSAGAAGPSTIVVRKAFCRVSGVIAPAIKYEIWLPLEIDWNGKFLGVGNGGLLGAINYPLLETGLASGFATVSSDLGHEGGVFDGSFAMKNPSAVVDWGYRATHEMTTAAKAVIAAYYGRAHRHSYFIGCSGGGRQGLIEAQRFPKDYEGILAGDPTINFTHLTTGGRLWVELVMLRDAKGAGYLPPSKIPMISAAVNSACDSLDGVADGVLEDPRQCRFDPASLRCPAGDQVDCLTGPQIEALKKIYSGAVTTSGERIYPGYMRGGEVGPGGWGLFISGEAPFKAMQWVYASGYLKGMVFEDPKYDPATFDYDTDIKPMDAKPILGEHLADVINGMNPNLDAFDKNGGKMILYHGWSDSGVSPQNTIDYYQSAITAVRKRKQSSTAGTESALGHTQSFFRLFMAPGMQHCSSGPGPNAFGGAFQLSVPDDEEHNALRILEKWVEQGLPPTKIIATKYIDDAPGKGVQRTRPLCAYPAVAKYHGSGSTDDASNFVCVQP
jgi:feruloyl esterase